MNESPIVDTGPDPINSNKCKLLKFFYSNCRSICNKLPDLNILLSSLEYDVLIFSETWLNQNVPNSLLLNNCDYSIHRADRLTKVGGGVCVIYKKFLKTCIIPVDIDLGDDIQMLCIDFLGSPVKYRLIVCYVPPSVSDEIITRFSNFFETSRIMVRNATTIICGDFNLPSNRKLSSFR